jgi:hypothetical protein
MVYPRNNNESPGMLLRRYSLVIRGYLKNEQRMKLPLLPPLCGGFPLPFGERGRERVSFLR